MAKKPGKKKPPKAVGSPVPAPPNATLGKRVGHAILSGIIARYVAPSIAHVASLPERFGLGIGLDDEKDSLASAMESLASPPPPIPTGYTRGVETKVAPPVVGYKKAKDLPVATPLAPVETIPKIGGRALVKQAKHIAIGGGRLARNVGNFLAKHEEGAKNVARKALKYGLIGGALTGGTGAGIGAGVGAAIGGIQNLIKRPEGTPLTDHLVGGAVRGVKALGKHVLIPAGKGIVKGAVQGARHLSRDLTTARQAIAKHRVVGKASQKVLNWMKSNVGDPEKVGNTIGNSKFGQAILRGGQKLVDKINFDNENLTTPSSTRRTTNKLSPGRALMTSLRAANEKYKIPNQTQSKPEHPSKTEEGKAFRNAALEALKRANRGDTSALATALCIANLEVPEGHTQAVGQANGVPDPIRGRVDHGTRHERKEVMELGKAIDNLKHPAQGQTLQNPSSQRCAQTPLSPGRKVMEELRRDKVMKQRMQRAMNPLPEGFSN